MALRPALWLLGLAVVTYLVLACGDSDRLSSEAYFRRVAEVHEEFVRAGEELSVGVPDRLADGSEEQRVMEIRRLLADLLPFFEESVEEIASLAPPEHVEDLHNDYVEAGRSLAGDLEELLALLESASTLDEADRLVNAYYSGERSQRYDSLCIELQKAARAEGIAVDLECGA